jgi:hypothetical protein
MCKNKILALNFVKSAYDPYSHLWFKWKYSEDCFLNKDEIITIETYLRTGEINEACKRLKISKKEAIKKLNSTTYKLFYGETIFFKWMLSKFFEMSRNWFVNLPISKVPIPIYYRKEFAKLNCSTLKDGLEKYTVFDFYQLWSESDADEFVRLMSLYECDSLLRISNN